MAPGICSWPGQGPQTFHFHPQCPRALQPHLARIRGSRMGSNEQRDPVSPAQPFLVTIPGPVSQTGTSSGSFCFLLSKLWLNTCSGTLRPHSCWTGKNYDSSWMGLGALEHQTWIQKTGSSAESKALWMDTQPLHWGARGKEGKIQLGDCEGLP